MQIRTDNGVVGDVVNEGSAVPQLHGVVAVSLPSFDTAPHLSSIRPVNPNLAVHFQRLWTVYACVKHVTH